MQVQESIFYDKEIIVYLLQIIKDSLPTVEDIPNLASYRLSLGLNIY